MSRLPFAVWRATRRARLLAWLLTILLGSASPVPAQVPGWNRGLDAELDSIRRAWNIPGMAVAVVARGEVIHLKGYGWRDVDAKLPVTPETKFAIASISKSFTVSTLAVLAKQGKLQWDGLVRDYVPEFRAYDPVVTERATVRDLVTMRTGIARHDLMWGIGTFSREELVHRLRYLQPNRDFRTAWQYQNLMYTTAGYLAGRVAGSSWEALVQREILDPLRMTSSGTSEAAFVASPNMARRYALHEDGQVRLVPPMRSTDPIAPTGGIHASLDDMTRYLTMHMQGGRFEGREILAPADSRAMQTPQMAMQRPMTMEAGEFRELGDEAYGMGFLVTHYRGHKLVHHPGNWDGYSLELSFLPDDSVGVVVLTNMYSTTVRDFIPWLVYDRLLGLSPSNWNARFLDRLRRARALRAAARAREDSGRVPNAPPSHSLDAYVGTYSHA
ncbi:MAG TPA: serine hydrolase, partial [Gemmatimonadaceae bacterium]|nr:serine hydrolase [Gemmatimonadaceae bacterium]